MHQGIPIVVTQIGMKDGEFGFKFANPQLLEIIRKNRTSSVRRQRQQILVKHQTLDPDEQQMTARTKRISSSAAAKRFPKDFFKDENCLNPIKTNRPKHKQHDVCFFDTFSQKNFAVCNQDIVDMNDCTKENDTPKFKQKGEKNSINKARANQFLSHKKIKQNLVTPACEKYSSIVVEQIKMPLLQINDQQHQKPLNLGPIPFISNFQLTLGQKQSLTTLLQKGIKKRRRQQIGEKQNNNFEPVSKTSRRQSIPKVDGFRIRRKVLG